ncbi:MAG TPA: heme ABC transporter ATP-binding protein [Dehalococcoidia bacterium]|nr:heme ABC transporter ATP-binding protein [Dehalococcoidia bacterium]
MVGLEIKQVSFSYSNGLVLHDVDLSVKAGEMVGLLGPNGSGKTTLIKLASGVLKPGKGEIWLNGSTLSQMRRRAIARSIAVMPQQFHIPFAFKVGEVVMLGRIPFIRALTGETKADREAVGHALEVAGVTELENRRFDELSGGERQKVILAMVLAQQPQVLLLDEPTLHLDITHQVEILELVRGLNRQQNLTVVAAMHDLNLASLYFDRLVLLKEGRVHADGTPLEVITEDMLRKVFGASVKVEAHPATGTPHVVVMPEGTTNKASQATAE